MRRARTGVPLQSLTTLQRLSSVGYRLLTSGERHSADLGRKLDASSQGPTSVEGSGFWVEIVKGFNGSAYLWTSRTGWEAGGQSSAPTDQPNAEQRWVHVQRKGKANYQWQSKVAWKACQEPLKNAKVVGGWCLVVGGW